MESRVSLGGKESHTNIQISAEPGSNWGPCARKAKILQLHQLCPPKLLILSELFLYCSQAYRERNMFILTQAPLAHTIEHFWSMVYDHTIGLVVMLNSLNEGGMVMMYGISYWGG